ncbi:cold shock domain-containing protein [Candidatus Bathyarchaeota archaeon]|nr:cold shock domain-containing protein [Candidatus Bathyarchaeota archaeon]
MKGKIIKYFSFRGFGFIALENSQDEIFFHVSNYPELVPPEIGKDVEFELIETPKGKEATNIKILTDTPADEPVDTSAEPVEAESPEASILEVGEIKGVGKATEEKLRGAGFDTVESIASVDAGAVSEKTGISSKVAAKLVASAKELLE